MSKQVRVGIVGTSWWADLMYLPALKSHPQAELTAICGRNRERAEEMAQKYGVSQVFTDYQTMIEQSGIEALIVGTPDDLHHPITIAAFEAGLHVLCDKPLALTLENVKEMVSKAEATKVKHMALFTYRWLPPLQYLHQLIKAGYLGRIFHSQFRYIGGGGRRGTYGWKWDRARGLGVLGDFGVHMIDLAHWLIGDIDKVNAHLPTYIERQNKDGQPLEATNDAALLTLKFRNGSAGVIQVSALAHIGDRRQEMQFTLYGEEGTLEFDYNFKDGYTIRGAKSDEGQVRPLTIPDNILRGINPTDPLLDQYNQIFTQQSSGVRLFVESIISDQEITPNFYDGLKAQGVIDAAITSNQKECWVTINLE